MLEAVILKSPELARFHLGEFTENDNLPLSHTAEILHSDVLTGAFISNLAFRYPDHLPDFLEHFRNSRLSFSSGFYCIADHHTGIYTYLLPKPLNLETFTPSQDNPKYYKQLRFISSGLWHSGIPPKDWPANQDIALTSNGVAAFQSELPTEANKHNFELYEVQDAPKVAVRTAPNPAAPTAMRGREGANEPENEAEGKFYYQSDLVLRGKDNYQVHWYFLLHQDGLGEDEQAILGDVLEGIRTSGLGGERSTGAGHIQAIERYPFDSLLEGEGQNRLSISLTLPKDANEFQQFQLYRTKKRGGRYDVRNQKRLRVVQMLQEGAIQKQPALGKDVELGQEQLRCGYNLSLPLPKALEMES